MGSHDQSNMDWSYSLNTNNQQWQANSNQNQQQQANHQYGSADVSIDDYDTTGYGNQQYAPTQQINTHHQTGSYNQQHVMGGGQPSYNQVNTHQQGYPSMLQDNYSAPPNQYANMGQNFMSDPVFAAAQQFGGQFATAQKEKLVQYLDSFQLKYYFAVSNNYVARKLGILLVPFIHRDWAVQTGHNGEPSTPKQDVNAPDLYIPLMAFITYVLLSGLVLGIQQRFTPEQLGVTASNVLIYLFLENVIIIVSRYVMNLSNALGFWHSLAFSSYKYVGMVVSLVSFLMFGKTVFNFVLLYCAVAIIFFLLRTVKVFIMDSGNAFSEDARKKRKLYLIMFITFSQPLIMWWLTSSVTSFMPDNYDFAKMAMNGIGLGANSKVMPLDANGDVDYEALLKAGP
uniref:Protein YIF1 n=1 Tax=Rhabditophanes sp. KR3021 TaxID=114890 RepID=A0AC35TQG0_9BILA